jgi:hypothetical protein
MRSVANVVSYMKQQVVVDLLNASNRGIVKMEKSEIERLGRVIESSLDASFSRASSEIVSLTRSLQEK